VNRPTIIFLNGFHVPTWLSKTPFVWNDELWEKEGYNRVYLSSKTPTSDLMVEKETTRLCEFVNQFERPIVMGQSLGAWWAAQLGTQPEFNCKQLVFWTPLLHLEEYPIIFKTSPRYHPTNRKPNISNTGIHRSFTIMGDQDLIVPAHRHAFDLAKHFQSSTYHLHGGHFYQKNHKKGLLVIRDWLHYCLG